MFTGLWHHGAFDSGLALAVAVPPIAKAEASVAAAIDSRIFFNDDIEVAFVSAPPGG